MAGAGAGSRDYPHNKQKGKKVGSGASETVDSDRHSVVTHLSKVRPRVPMTSPHSKTSGGLSVQVHELLTTTRDRETSL